MSKKFLESFEKPAFAPLISEIFKNDPTDFSLVIDF
jgi:hypothetical protein